MELRVIGMFKLPYLTRSLYINTQNKFNFFIAQVTMLNVVGDTDFIDTVSSSSSLLSRTFRMTL